MKSRTLGFFSKSFILGQVVAAQDVLTFEINRGNSNYTSDALEGKDWAMNIKLILMGLALLTCYCCTRKYCKDSPKKLSLLRDDEDDENNMQISPV